MIQNQLIDYIGAQFKAGISKETVRAALIEVGWQVADVDDTLKKVTGDSLTPASVMPNTSSISSSGGSSTPLGTVQLKPIQPASTGVSMSSPATGSTGESSIGISSFGAKPMGSSVTSPSGSSVMPRTMSTGSFSPMDVMGGVATGQKPVISGIGQTARSSVAMPTSTTSGTGMAAKVDAFTAGTHFNVAKAQDGPTMTSPIVSHKGERVSMIAEAIGLIALAALSIYFYTQNAALSMQVATLGAAGTGTSAAASDLTTQIQTLTTSNTALTSQVAGLMTQMGDLKTQLSFFAVPPLGAATTTATATVGGIVSTSVSAKGVYSIRTVNDAVIFVKNSTDPKVIALLKPLVGTTVTLAGNYLIGSDALTVTGVNGILVNPPLGVSTSTPSSTPLAPAVAPTTAPASLSAPAPALAPAPAAPSPAPAY